ncbi:MAG TPA: type 1 glutamine amidotransferase domain-containing protein [Oxalicibacterium sp.]|jgi:protease I|nr:type 1 glutamine amidotransferase domain-containing protein [Oxalicibacterium sp.]
MNPTLRGMQIAILVTDGFEQAEFTEPKAAFEREGAATKVASQKPGQVQGFKHDSKADRFDVDMTFKELDAKEFDAVLLPGGVMNADTIRTIPEAQAFVKDMQKQGKPIAVICHGGWLLVSSGLVAGRTMTSWPSLQDDIRNAGGKWLDREVVVDGNWVSSRKPDDIPAFNSKAIELIAGYRKSGVEGTEDEHAVGLASG